MKLHLKGNIKTIKVSKSFAWDLNYNLSAIIASSLKKFKEVRGRCGVPGFLTYEGKNYSIDTYEDSEIVDHKQMEKIFNSMLDNMIFAFAEESNGNARSPSLMPYKENKKLNCKDYPYMTEKQFKAYSELLKSPSSIFEDFHIYEKMYYDYRKKGKMYFAENFSNLWD